MKRRRLGQHYLTDPEVIREMVAAADIQPHEKVLEIGTGRGVLTWELARLGSKLEGYEVDRENYASTLEKAGSANAVVHLGDAFKKKPSFDVLVSSLPYSRSETFIEWISQVDYDRALVLLQEDFTSKIMAAPGTRNYRAISAIAQISSEITVLRRVGRGSFSPPPKVSSVLASFKPRIKMSPVEISNVKRLFSLRRRQVASALAELEMASRMKDYGGKRVYSLEPDEVHALCSPSPG